MQRIACERRVPPACGRAHPRVAGARRRARARAGRRAARRRHHPGTSPSQARGGATARRRRRDVSAPIEVKLEAARGRRSRAARLMNAPLDPHFAAERVVVEPVKACDGQREDGERMRRLFVDVDPKAFRRSALAAGSSPEATCRYGESFHERFRSDEVIERRKLARRLRLRAHRGLASVLAALTAPTNCHRRSRNHARVLSFAVRDVRFGRHALLRGAGSRSITIPAQQRMSGMKPWPRHRISKKNRKRLGHGCIFVWSGGRDTRSGTMPPKRRRERCPEIPFRVRDLLAPVNAARPASPRAPPDTRAQRRRARGHHRRGRGAQPRRAGTDGPRQAGGDDASRLDAPHALAPHDRVPRRPPRQARRPVRARARARATPRAATDRAPASVSLAQA